MKKVKNCKIYFINIVVCIFIFLLILIINKISPFGNHMLGISDAPLQFKPMLYSLIMRIRTGTLLNYTFSNGLGNATMFDFLYYIASPINIIALLFKSPDMMYLSATLIKIIMAAICMTFYTKKKTDNNYTIFISTISYVFCTWFIAYYYYLPWLDIFLIFPLFQYGLEKLLDDHKYYIYILCLSYMIASNLYLCFAVCIYTIIFFIIYELLYKKETFKKKLLTFDYIALATMFSFLVSFFYLYGWYDSMIKIKLGFNKNVVNAYTVSIMDFLKSFYYANRSFVYTMEGKTFPNIACPTIILISFIYYFFSKEKKRNKLFVLLSIALCIAIIFIPKLDFIMNAFHKIRGLTYRYSFIISFLMIWLFIRTSDKEKIINKKYLIITIFIVLIGNILLIKAMDSEIFVISTTFILCYLVLIIFYDNNKFYKKLSLMVFLLQILVVSNIYLDKGYEKETPKSINYNTKTITYRINNLLETEDKDVESLNNYFNNRTTFVYSSMTYSKVIYLFHHLGNTTFDTTYSVMHDNNKIPTLLLNVKSKENDYYLEKIYSVNKEILDTSLDEGNIKYNIESIIFNMTGIKDIYDKEVLKGKKNGKNYEFKTNKDYYLIDTKNDSGGYNNIAWYYKYFVQEIKYGDGTASIYTVNDKKLKEIYDKLKKNQIEYTYYKDNHIKGDINVDKGQMIFTSIPYDKDWIVKVDGKKVDAVELLDSLMGIEVKPGKHKIELEYKTHYFIPALISTVSLIVLIIDYIRKRIKH